MQFHQLQRVHKNKRSVQVGRGSKRGKTSGRGGKGQTARAGHKVRPEIRDMIKALPKLRGRGKNIFQSFQAGNIPVNLSLIEKHFSAGDAVNPTTLSEKGLAKLFKSGEQTIKILADGDLTKKITVSGCAVSASAKTKIEKAGGTVESKK